MSCTYHVKFALMRAADMKRVRDLFLAKDIMRFHLEEPEVFYCSVCGKVEGTCDHSECCELNWADYDYRYCPDCGEYLGEY